MAPYTPISAKIGYICGDGRDFGHEITSKRLIYFRLCRERAAFWRSWLLRFVVCSLWNFSMVIVETRSCQ